MRFGQESSRPYYKILPKYYRVHTSGKDGRLILTGAFFFGGGKFNPPVPVVGCNVFFAGTSTPNDDPVNTHLMIIVNS